MKKTAFLLTVGIILLFLGIFIYIGNVCLLHPKKEEPTLQKMIEEAPQGAHLTIKPGVYRENIDITGKNLTLIGYGVTLKSAKRNKPVLLIRNSEVRLRGLRIENSTGQCYDIMSCACGILILNSKVIVEEVTVRGNANVGILSVNSTTEIFNSIITGNHGDGFELQSSLLKMINVTVNENEWHGLSVFNSNLSALNVLVMDNGGNGLSSRTSKVDVRNATFSGNRYDGLGLIDTSLTITEALIVENYENGVFALSSRLRMNNVRIIGNRINGIAVLTSTLSSSKTYIGGSRVGIVSRNSGLKLNYANISLNSEHGVFASKSILEISNSSIDFNEENDIYITRSSLRLIDSSLRNSKVGVRIENSYPHLMRCLIGGNGYGVVLMGNSSLKLTASRIADNEYGIAIHLKRCGFLWDYFHGSRKGLTIVESTINDNKVNLCPEEYFVTSYKS